ncbi:MAG: hypothetical protein LBC83_08505 [Oscillospiraceae bacterium]|jgi:triacylglycerol lipase|nr:hypothetical protein [Oscillospiraceae bacterium]
MKNTKRAVCFVLAFALLLSGLALLGGCDGDPRGILKPKVATVYPFVFVHGLNGIGDEKIPIDGASYWGSTSGTMLLPLLKTAGYECYAPSVDPVGSAWDRACELYAQLMGGRVDYGAAHAEKYGHERFGVTYDVPLFPGWGTTDDDGNLRKVNLIGHSFGGATIRMLAALLQNGDDAEREAAPEDCSPLFAGKKEKWIFSLTCLAAPHNGVSILAMAREMADSVAGRLAVAALESMKDAADLTKVVNLLNSFGIKNIGGFDISNLGDALNGLSTGITGKTVADTIHLMGTPDNAYYDLSIEGAAALNTKTQTCKGTYYFSYPVDGTRVEAGKCEPTDDMISIIQIPARIIGGYTGSAGGVTIDESWLPNDGLVNTISATAPFGQSSEDVLLDAVATSAATGVGPVNSAFAWAKAKENKWYVMPTTRGDHGTLIGMGKDEAYLRAFYLPLLEGLNTLSREVTG